MQFLEFEFNEWRCLIKKYSDIQMYILGEFFRSEVDYYSTNWINWINNKNSLSMRGNRIWLEKINNEYIAIGDETIDSPDDFTPVNKDCLIIKVTDLSKLLDQWNNLHIQNIKKIKIIKDHDKIEMFEIT